MDCYIETGTGNDGLPYQIFQGKKYKLHTGEYYFSKITQKLHWAVWEHYNGEREKGKHIHHKDGDRTNNHISNLEAVDAFEHLSTHAKERFRINPGHKERFYKAGVEAAKDWHGSEEGNAWHRQHAANFNFGKKTYGKRKCEVCSSEFEAWHKSNGEGGGSHRFCSNKCKSTYRRASGVDDVTRNCANCGKPFTRNKYYYTKNCSRTCGAALRKKNKSASS